MKTNLGWPEWVMNGHNETEIMQFEYDLNKMQGWGLLSLIVLNIFPGLAIDFMRTKLSKPYDPDYGAAIGLAISMTISTTLLVYLGKRQQFDGQTLTFFRLSKAF